MDAETVADLLAAFGPVRVKRMFGGLGVFADGLMLALVIDDTLYFKADPALAERLAAGGSVPFTYDRRGRRVELGYWSAPEAALDDAEALAEIARAALAVARRSPAKAKRGPPTRRQLPTN
ncbi:TfoX/Sxy family protein [Ancylobacter defluvii]|uniref:Transcriptional regulator n=1 Tax=Ancylobacter defluvii TaxID=1282440 RepID=A0A9W6N9N5_9HYPH|nr:TfoX/Sxy family protein [Ancylobacter defluvii]MBS7587806.1 TfoX/Sxy family protein [Ancylobacter defluvii]GLK82616.1 transcriptional regulator [Ancylobacter defluvii]